jgi:hypothetical protein
MDCGRYVPSRIDRIDIDNEGAVGGGKLKLALTTPFSIWTAAIGRCRDGAPEGGTVGAAEVAGGSLVTTHANGGVNVTVKRLITGFFMTT